MTPADTILLVNRRRRTTNHLAPGRLRLLWPRPRGGNLRLTNDYLPGNGHPEVGVLLDLHRGVCTNTATLWSPARKRRPRPTAIGRRTHLVRKRSRERRQLTNRRGTGRPAINLLLIIGTTSTTLASHGRACYTPRPHNQRSSQGRTTVASGGAYTPGNGGRSSCNGTRHRAHTVSAKTTGYGHRSLRGKAWGEPKGLLATSDQELYKPTSPPASRPRTVNKDHGEWRANTQMYRGAK